MMTGTLTFWLLAAFLGLAAWQLLGKRVLSTEAKCRRRRDRNHRRVISRRHRPAVKLAVKVARS